MYTKIKLETNTFHFNDKEGEISIGFDDPTPGVCTVRQGNFPILIFTLSQLCYIQKGDDF